MRSWPRSVEVSREVDTRSRSLILALCATLACSQHGEPDRPAHARSAAADPAARESDAPRWALAPESRFEVRTGKAGILGSVAHEHRIRAGKFTGSMHYDAERPQDASFEIEVPVADLEVLTAAKPDDKAKIRKAMLEKVLHADQYPEIRFASRRVEPTPDGLRVEGDLTLLAATRPVRVDLAIQRDAQRLSARGSFSVLQSDFGIEPYHAALGTIQVADRVTFDFEAIGTR